MSRAIPRSLMAALTFGSVFVLGWLGSCVLATGGTGFLQDDINLSWAFVLPVLTLSTTAGALAALRLLGQRANAYGRWSLLGRVALAAILTLLLCPVAMFGAFELTSVAPMNHSDVVFSCVLAACGLVVGAAGLMLGLRLPLGTELR
jgi:hypothetical protein